MVNSGLSLQWSLFDSCTWFGFPKITWFPTPYKVHSTPKTQAWYWLKLQIIESLMNDELMHTGFAHIIITVHLQQTVSGYNFLKPCTGWVMHGTQTADFAETFFTLAALPKCPYMVGHCCKFCFLYYIHALPIVICPLNIVWQISLFYPLPTPSSVKTCKQSGSRNCVKVTYMLGSVTCLWKSDINSKGQATRNIGYMPWNWPRRLGDTKMFISPLTTAWLITVEERMSQ